MHIRLYPLRFTFRARENVSFANHAANRLRGAFGAILHKLDRAAVFQPVSESGPSGFRDRPRPYVFRAHHLDGAAIAPGETFEFGFHWFDRNPASLDLAIRAFGELSGAELLEVQGSEAPVQVSLDPVANRVDRVTICFQTPTELKVDGRIAAQPEFGVLAARVRDRISTLCALYGEGPLDLNFREFRQRAARVRMRTCDIRHVEASRRSGRTGQVHSLGGFTGHAEYEGDLAQFVPFLEAAYWTGVGRQTAWGKGVLAVTYRAE